MEHGNRLLGWFNAEARRAGAPAFTRVAVKPRDELVSANAPLESLWFPESGAHAQLVESADGGCVNVATVGPEGVIGVAALFGAQRTLMRTVVLTEATMVRVPIREFRKSVGPDHPLFGRMARYATATLACMAQSVACNRLHRTEQRFCRWLLNVSDRAGDVPIPITHDAIALMLGVRRPSVTEVAQSLQNEGGIRYERGVLRLADRAIVERRSCECYGIARRAQQEAQWSVG